MCIGHPFFLAAGRWDLGNLELFPDGPDLRVLEKDGFLRNASPAAPSPVAWGKRPP